MKKILLFLLIVLSLSLTGCKKLFGGGDDDKEVYTTVKVDNEGDVWLVKLNNSGSIIKGEKTGYVSGVTKRAADDDETEVTGDVAVAANPAYYDTDSFIRNLNNSVINDVNDSLASSRAADYSDKFATGYRDDDFGETEKFWSYTSVKQKNTITGKVDVNIAKELNTTKKYEGTHCYVYADDNNGTSASEAKGIKLTDTDYENLGKKFDACYELETAINGNPLYNQYRSDVFVPCNEKIIILVSDLFGDAKDVEYPSGTVGYFYSGDLFSQTMLDNDITINKGKSSTADDYIHSNQCEIFYIDALFYSKMPDTVYSTLVHEFNHMINFVIKTLEFLNENPSVNYLRGCDTWFTEMLSMTTEDMFQKYLGIKDEDSPKVRLPYFGMSYYYGFKNWDDKNVDPLVFYANTYAFGAFLARNFGGVDLIKEIAQNEYINERAITEALRTVNPNLSYEDDLTHETKKIDFTYALRKFTMCVIDTDGSRGYSLNKSTAFKNNLGFTAVDISTTYSYQGREYPVPFTFKSGKDGQIDLYPTGFTVHYLGRNLKSFKLVASDNKNLEYYLIK